VKPRQSPSGSTGTLGDVLRRSGVAVGHGAEPEPAARTPAAPAIDPIDFGGATKIVVRREKKGRGGKTATVVEGIKRPPSALEAIARELKRALGCGASIDRDRIVVQGDMAARIEPWLVVRGAKKVVIGN
jgi:translation initiation factor 1